MVNQLYFNKVFKNLKKEKEQSGFSVVLISYLGGKKELDPLPHNHILKIPPKVRA